MKVNKQLFCFVLAAMTLSSCNMDYNEYLQQAAIPAYSV